MSAPDHALPHTQTGSPPQTSDPSSGLSWRRLADMVLSFRRELVLANVIAVLGTMVNVPIPLLIPLLVDEVLLHQPATAVGTINQFFPEDWHGPVLYISVILLLTLVLRLIGLVFGVWQARQFTRISKDITYRIRRSLLLKLRKVSMSEYETLGSGTVASHLVTDVTTLDNFIGGATSKFLVAVLSIIGTAIVLLWMHWQLALFILLLNPVVIYVTTIMGRRVKDLKTHENTAYQEFQESLTETLEGIQQIRASNREKFYIERIVHKADRIRHYSSAYAWKSDAAGRLSFMVFLFGFDVFRALSMVMVLYSGLTIGEMLAVFAYLWFMMAPVQEVLGIQYAYHSASAALQRLNKLLNIPQEPHYPHLRNPFADKLTVGLRLENIRFAYGDGPLVLNDVSLDVAPGEKVALVGASGGGKTTLVQVLLGLYAPQSGSIYFDSVPVTEIGMDCVRDHVATVLQHPALFNDTVRMNLTLGREVSEEQLWHALDIAQLSQTIHNLDKGLETLVGRDGVRLSGGQRQRLAVARMVLTNPSVVILDEATSALDTKTERNLHSALQEFLRGRTTLIIAHRLSAVKQADRALVFEDGHIVEEGTHDELVQIGGLYASLYGRQEEGHPHADEGEH